MDCTKNTVINRVMLNIFNKIGFDKDSKEAQFVICKNQGKVSVINDNNIVKLPEDLAECDIFDKNDIGALGAFIRDLEKGNFEGKDLKFNDFVVKFVEEDSSTKTYVIN